MYYVILSTYCVFIVHKKSNIEVIGNLQFIRYMKKYFRLLTSNFKGTQFFKITQQNYEIFFPNVYAIRETSRVQTDENCPNQHIFERFICIACNETTSNCQTSNCVILP